MTPGRCQRPSQHNAIYTAAATARESQPHMEGVIWLVNGVTIAHYRSVIFRSAWITSPTLLNVGCRANLSCAAVLSGGIQSNPWRVLLFFLSWGKHTCFSWKIFHLLIFDNHLNICMDLISCLTWIYSWSREKACGDEICCLEQSVVLKNRSFIVVFNAVFNATWKCCLFKVRQASICRTEHFFQEHIYLQKSQTCRHTQKLDGGSGGRASCPLTKALVVQIPLLPSLIFMCPWTRHLAFSG